MKMKKINFIAGLVLGAFVFSLFAPMVFATPPAIKTGDNLQDSLTQLRKDRDDFKNNKLQEKTKNANATKEKVASKRKLIEAKQEELRLKKEEKRKAVLVRLIEIQIKQMENTRERVAKMSNISVELKTQLNASIDAAVAVLTAKKAEAVAAATSEQMKELAKEIKELFKTKRDIVRQIVDAILASRADKAIVAAEGRLTELKAKIAEMKIAGQDTAALDNLLAIAQGKISAAKTKAGKEDLKGVINELKEAYRNMKILMEKAEKQPVLSPPPISTPPVSFQCPAAGYINCMPVVLQPGETLSAEMANLCSGEYHQWIKINCSDVEFAF
ncbi:hypothetical protein KKB43_03650 [Patescibacteria group bacterium]|nr:hypothetical protein [Patescibacteria group bacterium]